MGAEDIKFQYYGSSLKNSIFRWRDVHFKNNKSSGRSLKKEAWTVGRFKIGLSKKERVVSFFWDNTPRDTMGIKITGA